MSYIGSHMWQLRQKVGDMRVITATANVLPIDQQGRVKLVYANHFDCWTNVGGHVELGDSWESAAINELREEAGITATADDLELFATMSGPSRIFHYPDGSTQPFSVAFICRGWSEENSPEDTEEVSQTAWLTLEEAKTQKTNPHTASLLAAYETYLKTHKVQMIVE